MRTLLLIALLTLTGCGGITTDSDWTGSPARWYAVGERLDCPATMYLSKAFPGTDAWAKVQLMTCDPAALTGPLGTLPDGAHLMALQCHAEGEECVQVVAVRHYAWEYADGSRWYGCSVGPTGTTLVQPLVWIMAAPPFGWSIRPYCVVVVWGIEAGRARIELRVYN